MANNFTDYLEQKILNDYFVTPANCQVGLFTSDPTDTGSAGTEVTGGAYARQTMLFSAPAVNGTTYQTANSAQIDFPTATASWGTITHYVIFDGTGNPLVSGPLASSKTIANGDIFRIPAGNCTVSVD